MKPPDIITALNPVIEALYLRYWAMIRVLLPMPNSRLIKWEKNNAIL